MRDPRWWSSAHDESWQRVRGALRRSWEDDTRQAERSRGVDETRQETRAEARGALSENWDPPVDQAASVPDDDFEPASWQLIAQALRYGAGGAEQYPEHGTWTYELEARLRRDWGEANDEERWAQVRDAVRRGWETAKFGH